MRYRVLHLLLATLLCYSNAQAQSLTGLWHGYITADGVNTRGFFALNLQDQEKDILSGKTYLNRPDLHPDAHNILQFIGTLSNNKIKITELKILDEKLPPDLVTCIKFSTLEYSKKENNEFLTGEWHGYSEDGELCLPGKVFLKKQVSTEPDLFNSLPDFIHDDIKKNANKKPLFLNTELITPIIIPVKNLTVRFELNDYMVQDNDTVSVYYNRTLVLDRIPITKRTKKFTIRLNKHSDLNEFILYAENLGRIPPNTSTLTIIDGKKKYHVSIETTKQKSAVIYLRRSEETDPKKKP